jgi:flagellar biosynthesis protein FlhA
MHAYELLGRQETQHLLDNMAESYPKVVEELVPNQMTLGNVQKVLQNLLKERVSILDLRTILETLADFCPFVKNVTQLTELARQALSRTIVKPYLTNQNDLPVIVMGGAIENLLAGKLEDINGVEQLVLQPDEVQKIVDKVRVAVDRSGTKVQPILLCSSRLRPHLKIMTEKFIPSLVVLSASEVPGNVKIVSLGVIE